MFDNPEKLFIILVIALLIFGPSKLAGLGGTFARTIREFRSAMRGAHETFTSELEQAGASLVEPQLAALPAPDPMVSAPVQEATHAPSAWEPGGTTAPSAEPHSADAEFDGAASLASEPTAEALRKSLQGRG